MEHMGTPDRNLLAEARDGVLVPLYEFCPGAYARMPVADTVERAWRWWSKGQLGLLYASGVPPIVIEAVEFADVTNLEWRAEGARLSRQLKEPPK